MKRNKLNFEEISQSMEVLDRDSQRGVKGGDAPSDDCVEHNLVLPEVVVFDTPTNRSFTYVTFWSRPSGFGSSYDNYNQGSFGSESYFGGGGGSVGARSSNINLDWWGSMLQSLGNLASISEMGSHGVFNLQAAEAFGKLGFIADIGGVVLDGMDLLNYYKNGQGNMDGIRFSIRSGSTAMGIMEASMVGGPKGVLVGAMAAGVSWSFEEMYDYVQIWIEKVAQGCTDFENGISRGWIPGYN